MADKLKTCQQCHQQFVVKYPRAPNKFCSCACAGLAGRRRVTRTCAECGVEFETRVSQPAKFCSPACRYKVARMSREQYAAAADEMSRKRRGRGNPAFKHGKRTGQPRRSTFSLTLKGEDCCRNCGSTFMVQLHHAIPRSLSRAARDEILNGLPLCVSCHTSWHKRGATIYRDVFTEEEWAYISSVQLTGQEIEAWLEDRYPVRPAGADPASTIARRRLQREAKAA